ncbi:MAG: TolC family outer membrane protein [Cycloclasticus sp.]
MIKKSIIKVYLERICIGVLVCLSQTTHALTLNETVAQTLQTNPELMADISRRLSTDHTVGQARAAYFPKVDVSLGIGREWSRNPSTPPEGVSLNRREQGIALRQMIYDGFATKNEVEKAQLLVEAAAYQVASSSERLGFEAANAFLEVLRYEDLLVITQENLTSHQAIYQQIESRSSSGVDRGADLEQARGRVALSEANLMATKGNFADAKTSFQRVTGSLPEGELEKLGERCCDGLPLTLNEGIETAFEGHPTIRSSNARYEASLAETQVANALFSPRLDLEVGSNMNHEVEGISGKNQDVLAMIKLRYNLYNGGADQARINETEYLTAQQKEIVLDMARNIQEEVRLSWNELYTAIENLPHLKLHAESAANSHSAYQQQFDLGKRTLLDLLDMENEKFTSKANYINGYYQERISYYRLLASMGILVKTLNLPLNEASVVAP